MSLMNRLFSVLPVLLICLVLPALVYAEDNLATQIDLSYVYQVILSSIDAV